MMSFVPSRDHMPRIPLSASALAGGDADGPDLGGPVIADRNITALLLIWVGIYLVLDLVMWAGGRSTLASNIIISLPMLMSGVLATLALEWLRRQLWSRNPAPILGWMGVAIVGAAAIQCLVDYMSVRVSAALFFLDWEAFVPHHPRQFAFGIYVYAVHFTLCLLVLAFLRARQAIDRAIVRQAETLSAKARAEARALRLQLNPHFLFNALNSIAALVAAEGNRVADAMICRLSDFLRAAIASDPGAHVSLSSELATTEAYLAIERLRLGDRLEVSFDIAAEAWHAAIPGFILQPLVENAVKHGLTARDAAIALTIAVRREDGDLLVQVTDRRTAGPPPRGQARAAGCGIGLTNIRQRLSLLDSGRARLETEARADGFRATLRLPYRRGGDGR